MVVSMRMARLRLLGTKPQIIFSVRFLYGGAAGRKLLNRQNLFFSRYLTSVALAKCAGGIDPHRRHPPGRA